MLLNPGISGAVTSFSDLLDQQLKSFPMNGGRALCRKVTNSKSHPFLKRGAGLARYQPKSQFKLKEEPELDRENQTVSVTNRHCTRKIAKKRQDLPKPRLPLLAECQSREGLSAAHDSFTSKAGPSIEAHITPDSEASLDEIFPTKGYAWFSVSEGTFGNLALDANNLDISLSNQQDFFSRDLSTIVEENETSHSSFRPGQEVEKPTSTLPPHLPVCLDSTTSATEQHEVQVKQKKEDDELAVFEMLEKVALNCSFSSDSSLFQKLIQNDKPSPMRKVLQDRVTSKLGKTHMGPYENSKNEKLGCSDIPKPKMTITSPKLVKLLQTVQRHRQHLEEHYGSMLAETDLATLSDAELESSAPKKVNRAETVDDFVRELSPQGDFDNDSEPTKDANVPFNDERTWMAQTLSDYSLSNTESDSDDSAGNHEQPPEDGGFTPQLQVEPQLEPVAEGRNCSYIENDTCPVIPSTDTGHIKQDIGCRRWTAEGQLSLSTNNCQQIPDHVDVVDKACLTDSLSPGRVQLQHRMHELEEEITIFHKENAILAKLRQEHEEKLRILTKEKEGFYKQRENELQKMKEDLDERNARLRKEKELFDRLQKAKKEFPDKQERDEIARLKREVDELQANIKRREIKWTAECGRLRTRISGFESEKEALRTEMRQVEAERGRLCREVEELKNKGKRLSQTNRKLKQHQCSLSKENVQPSPKARRSNEEPLPPLKNQNKQVDSDEITGAQTTRDSFKEQSEEIVPNETPKMSAKRPLKVHFNLEPEVSSPESPDTCTVVQYPDKVEKIYENGERVITYASGTEKQLSRDGQITMTFYNGDVKQVFADQTVVYRYAHTGTKQTTYLSGLEILEFSTGQVEKLEPDGTKVVSFPNGSVKIIHPSGTEESQMADGTVIQTDEEGTETIHFPSGQREIRTQEYKRREYPDGTSKTLYADGKVETRYASGRLRIRDADGHMIHDSKQRC